MKVMCFLIGFFSLVDLTLAQGRFQNDDIIIFHQVAKQDTTYHVYLKLSLSNNLSGDSLQIACENCQYTQERALTDSSIFVRSIQNEHVLRYSLPHSFSEINFQVFNDGKNIMDYPIVLKSDEIIGYPGFMVKKEITGVPVFHNYVSQRDTLNFETFGEIDSVIHVFYYDHDFPAALPPMVTEMPLVDELSIKSQYSISSESRFLLENEGLYFFQSDTLRLLGTSIVSKNKYFPKLVRPTDIIQPFRYILKKEEFAKLDRSATVKDDFDKLIVRLAHSRNNAKILVKNYFFRVKMANLFFTTYKEGWKTDMGMIFIIFGTPDNVSKTSDKITWQYRSIGFDRKFSFSFQRVKNIFSKEHYVLEREKSYDKLWLRAVDLWRNGRMSN